MEKCCKIDYSQMYSQMQEASGNIVIENKFTAFLYLLMMDKLTSGEVQVIINRVINEKNENEPFIYTNGWLAQYADYLRKLIETK